MKTLRNATKMVRVGQWWEPPIKKIKTQLKCMAVRHHSAEINSTTASTLKAWARTRKRVWWRGEAAPCRARAARQYRSAYCTHVTCSMHTDQRQMHTDRKCMHTDLHLAHTDLIVQSIHICKSCCIQISLQCIQISFQCIQIRHPCIQINRRGSLRHRSMQLTLDRVCP